MAENVRQHFVPATYLKFFTAQKDGKGDLFVNDGKTNTSRQSTPHQECKSRNYYGRGISTAKDIFRITFEDDYARLADKALDGKHLNTEEKLDFFLFMVHLYARNPSILQSVAEVDRTRIFEQLFDGTLSRLIPVRREDFNLGNMISAFDEHWDLRFLQTRVSKILTTDNPTSLLLYRWFGTLMVFMPVSSGCVALAVRRKLGRFVNNSLDKYDIQFLQSSIYGQRNYWSFCDFDMGSLSGSVSHIMPESQRPYYRDGVFSLAPCIYTQDLSCVRIIKRSRILAREETRT